MVDPAPPVMHLKVRFQTLMDGTADEVGWNLLSSYLGQGVYSSTAEDVFIGTEGTPEYLLAQQNIIIGRTYVYIIGRT